MKTTRKLIPALAMLIVSAVVMSSASFAWFTMSREVTAQGMDVTVSAPNNLLIKGKDDAGYSALGKTTVAAELVPASTLAATTFYQVANSGVAVNGTLIDGTTKLEAGSAFATAGTPGAYVDYHYYIKTDGSENVTVWVKDISVMAAGGATAYAAGDAKIHPVRFAVLAAAPAATETEGSEALIKGTTSGVYNPAGGANFKTPIADGTTGAAGTADQVVTAIDDTTKYAKTTSDITYLTDGVDTKTLAGTNKFSVDVGKFTSVIIRVWYEGQDTDCLATNAPGLANKFSIKVDFGSDSAA